MLRYLLPALIPSWRFFDAIGPSPRIEYCLLADDSSASDWQPFRPHPQHLPLLQLFRRLLWNPARNEALYLLSSCEKILARDSAQAQQVIAGRIAQALQSGEIPLPEGMHRLRFRLLEVEREAGAILQHERFVSPAYAIDARGGPMP